MTPPAPGRHRAPSRASVLLSNTGRLPGRPVLAVVASSGLMATVLLTGASGSGQGEPSPTRFVAADRGTGHGAAQARALDSPYAARADQSERASRSSTGRGATAAVDDAPVVAAPGPDEEAPVTQHGAVLAFEGVVPEPEAVAPAETGAAGSSTGSQAAPVERGSDASASRSDGREPAPASAESAAEQSAPAPAAAESGAGEGAIGWAMSHLGVPYGYGATGPGAYDCSGFTQAAFAAAGVHLPQGSGAQYSATRRVPLSDIRRGDLLFYSGSSGIYHVAIYLGDGQVVHALRDWSGGFSGSKVSGMHYSPGLMGAGRP